MMRHLKARQQTLAAAYKPVIAMATLLLLGAITYTAGAQVAAKATRTTLTVSAPQGGLEDASVLTAHVADFSGSVIHTGSVTFESAAGSLGAVPVDSEGNASITVTGAPPPAAGAQGTSVQAVYLPQAGPQASIATTQESEGASASGSAPPVAAALVTAAPGYAASVSAAAVLAPAASAVPNFTIVANPATVNTPQGQAGTTALTIAPQNGFAEQVTLSCSNLPAQVTCNFSPVIQSTAKGAFTSILQLQTQGASGPVALRNLSLPRGSAIALGWLLPGVLALASLAATRRRALPGAGLLMLSIAATLGLAGCNQRWGYIHHPPLTAPGTLKGSYPILVSASGNDGSAVTVHTLNVMLVVQ